VIERAIAATTHGRYLIAPPATSAALPLLVGFHGYAEDAETQLARLQAIPGVEGWLIVSIQGLNRFYQRRTNDVIAGWMTRQDRELAIADNIAYVAEVIGAVSREHAIGGRIVFAGFSQGVAMAFRAAAASTVSATGVVAVGGDVPPEIETPSLAVIGSALLCRGSRDEWYTSEKYGNDLRRLRDAGVAVQGLEFTGGHEWSDDVREAAGGFLRGSSR
jgi:predicted esterase